MKGQSILAIRLGAMGDIIHTLPAVASLRQSFSQCRLLWAVEPRWMPLLQDNPCIDELIPVDRKSLRAILELRSRLRAERPEIAVDFQGLIKSSAVALLAGAKRVYGLHRSAAREPLAALAYSHTCKPQATYIVDRHLELAACAGAPAAVRTFPLPQGRPEGDLPSEPFVLANPDAGWRAKEWPREYWSNLGRRLQRIGFQLVLNGRAPYDVPYTRPHVSSLGGLIDATRRARAVVGVDSGPLHLAGALGKPGVAIFGPTDPARNGPPGSTMVVLRADGAVTSYERRDTFDPSMLQISPEQVWSALQPLLTRSAF